MSYDLTFKMDKVKENIIQIATLIPGTYQTAFTILLQYSL